MYVLNIVISSSINQVPQCARKVDLSGVQMACQHLAFKQSNFYTRCTLAIVTFGKGAATVDL
jgi:hypothetical protein